MLKEWACRKSVAVGEKNIQQPTLADKILLPPLHMKLHVGLMKNFVKSLGYLIEKFPRLSEAKIKEGVCVELQIRELFKNNR